MNLLVGLKPCNYSYRVLSENELIEKLQIIDLVSSAFTIIYFICMIYIKRKVLVI
jgi:hypothetical protein